MEPFFMKTQFPIILMSVFLYRSIEQWKQY